MQHAGYAAGVEFGDGHIPRDYWKRVAKAQHDELAKVRGFKRHEWRPATARDYSQTGATAGVFQLARSQGIAAGKAENPDLSKMELMLAVP